MRSLAKTRPSPLVVETEVTISRGAFWVLSTVAPPSGKQQQQQQRKFIISWVLHTIAHAARKGATVEVSDQITTASTQEREREAETSTSTTDRWILTSVASPRWQPLSSYHCYVNCLHDLDISGPEWTRPEWTRGPGDQGTGDG